MAETAPDGVVFRRSARLKAAPLVVAAAIAIGIGYSRLVVPAGLVALYFLISGGLQYAFRLEISTERLRLRGYLGGPVDIAKATVNSCHYHLARVQGRSVELFFLEIAGLPGGSLRVWRYGWGGQRHRLLPMLDRWLAEANVELGERERAFLGTPD